MKKKYLFLGISLILIFGISTLIFINKSHNFFKKENDVKEINKSSNLDNENFDNDIEDNIVNVDIDVPNDNKDSIEQEVKEEVTSQDNNNDTPKNETSQNKVEPKPNNTTTEIPKEEPSKNESTPIQKSVCTTNNTEYSNWLKEFLGDNKTVRIFNSLNEAKNFGTNAAKNYGFGFYYSPYPTKFDGDTCYADVYTVELYAAAGDCGDNPIIYVDREQPLMDVFRYLETKGYSCESKSWF